MRPHPPGALPGPGRQALSRTEIAIARTYGLGPRSGEHRVLVDRLWPRGVSKEALDYDEWLKSTAPSTELRKWYGHDPERFERFAARYREELGTEAARAEIERLAAISKRKPLLLLSATRDLDRSGAAVLAEVIGEVAGRE